MRCRFGMRTGPAQLLYSDGLANLGPYRDFRCCGLSRLAAGATIKISGIYLNARLRDPAAHVFALSTTMAGSK
jgi:hypothetical protein